MKHIFNPDPDREKSIREALSQQLGVEFYSPDDPGVNRRVDVEESASEPDYGAERQSRPHSELRPISIGDIIRMAQQLGAHASSSRDTRRVLYFCCTALQQMVDRVEAAEAMVHKYQTAVVVAVDATLNEGPQEIDDDSDTDE